MHILYFFTYGYSLETWENSGILSREIKPYEELAKFGTKVTFVTFGEHIDEKLLINNDNIEVLPIYKFIKKSKYKLLNYFKSFLIPFVVYKRNPKFDIIKQNQLHGSWISIILKIISNKPLYIRTGYDMFLFSKYENKNPLKKFLYFLLTFVTFKFSDLYSVTNINDKKFLESNFKNQSNKIVVRPNWVPVGITKNYENRFNSKIIMVGRLTEQKNYFKAIDLLEGTGIKLDIVGSGDLKQKILKYAELKSVELSMLGTIKNETLISIYGNYKIYLSTSLYEGNSKSLLEAMSNGCVPFVTKIPNNEEIIKTDNNGFFINLNDYDQTRKELNSILNLSSDFNKYSINAKKYTSANNSLDQLVNSIQQDSLELIKYNL